MIIDDLIIAAAQLFFARAAALIELMIHLGALLFGASYMATRHTGMIRACDAARARIPTETETKVTESLDLAGKLLNRDLTSNLPCQSATD